MARVRVALALCAVIAGQVVLGSLSAKELESPQRFVMSRSSGRPVCAAFLKVLKESDFTGPGQSPRCGIPYIESSPGFAKLEHALLTEAEAERLFPRVYGFIYRQDQFANYAASHLASNIRAGYGSNIFAWRYPAVDLGNDGTKEDVLIWLGYGAGTLNEDPTAKCGGEVFLRSKLYPFFPAQQGFVLDSDGHSIDEVRTRAIFGRDENHGYFLEAGGHVGIFKFQSDYYIYAFYASAVGDIHGRHKGSSVMDHTLAVLHRSNGRTVEDCEILVP